MNRFKSIFFLLLVVPFISYSQLGSCSGSKGIPVFVEDFGSGTNYGPQLPSGVTNYTYIAGSPNDGFYTLFNRTNLYDTWHNSLDHTPNDTDGKALIVNGNALTTGEFYKRKVTGLCINTTFVFSSWLLNVYNPNSNFCGANEIPINVRFEIWDETESTLLGFGDTGSIIGNSSPNWQQFSLVFTTGNQTAVVLKMKNNSTGGCGNDLALDDIEFRSCGDFTTITSPTVTGDAYKTCSNSPPVTLDLEAKTLGSSSYFYQWQSSTDGVNWTDIIGANTANYKASNVTVSTYYRTKVAQDIANLGNDFCSAVSDIFTISFSIVTPNAVSNGDKTICNNTAIPPLTVSVNTTSGVNWYDSLTGGNLILANNVSYTPTSAGTYYAEAYDLNTTCTSNSRTPVSLTVLALPSVLISSVNTVYCGDAATINFEGTSNAIVQYKVDGGPSQTINLDASGVATITTAPLKKTIVYQLESISLSGSLSCIQLVSGAVSIGVTRIPVANYTGIVAYCSNEQTAINLTSDIVGTTFYWTVNSNGVEGVSAGNGDLISQNPISNSETDTVITYFVTPVYNGCDGETISIPVTIYGLPIPKITDGVICLNSSKPSSQFFTLDTQLNPTDFSFSWYYEGRLIPNANNSTYNADEIGNYTVEATSNITACTSLRVNAVINEFVQGQSLVIEQETAFNDNQSIAVTVVGGNGPFLYKLDSLDFQDSNVFNDVSSGTHLITVIDDGLCTNLEIDVTVINYPRYFTPNNDGFNDTWNIKDLDLNSTIWIFDRYGKLLKQINSSGLGWDGTFNGKQLVTDDYWFLTNYVEKGIAKTFRSHFTLKR
ncbi:T9SS type B sorting domain-containing protein [Flavobacterium degerlachei]|jgi:gliding motility-associated-like protein|uniref:Gliding motility-associated C-terminal domain-containing protein n=1 Tax=Flavobacterium degerlachei TaxID=229203 RepID=A0A1H2T479_9FLAO|nr:T9SS type B sorting domain-containing protein [Flavobacterium degerlachei]SDW38054.1 gliding motility-associated C-terminal domain-containing protein [Flavobacterium degerlachei]